MDSAVLTGPIDAPAEERYSAVESWGPIASRGLDILDARYVETSWKYRPRLGTRPTLAALQHQAECTREASHNRSVEQMLEISSQNAEVTRLMLFTAGSGVEYLTTPQRATIDRALNQLRFAVLWQKKLYDCPRPYHVLRNVGPMFTPANPSFPSATVAQARLLQLVITRLGIQGSGHDKPLDDMVRAIGRNRIYAGVSYPIDVAGGLLAADLVFEELDRHGLF